MRIRWILPGLILLVVLGGLAYRKWSTPPLRQLLDQAQQHIAGKRLDAATKRAEQAARAYPQSAEAAMMLSRVKFLRGDLRPALKILGPHLDRDDEVGVQANVAAGAIHTQLGEATMAETRFRRVIELAPTHTDAFTRLAILYTHQARLAEAAPLRLQLLRLGVIRRHDLLFLGNPQAIASESQELQSVIRREPQNPHVLVAQALLALRDSDKPQALKLLRAAVEKSPGLLPAQARLGGLLLDTASTSEFLKWQAALPPSASENADMWVVWGLWSAAQEDTKAAARCFWEALRRDPNHQVACYQLTLALTAAGQPKLAESVNSRAGNLQKLEVALTRINGTAKAQVLVMHEAGQLCEELGRFWEAFGWYELIAREDPKLVWAQASRRRLQTQLGPNLPLVDPDHNGTQQLDLASWPMPRFESSGVDTDSVAKSGADEQRRFRFEELATKAGIDFQYFNSDDPTTPGRRMFEFTGGGTAILDYDGDGWPDIYVTQGCPWPPQPNQTEYRDRLYRNLADGTFEDVTEAAGLGDERFGQGAAAGDFNNDGMPDLYVANVGQNRLYQNLGDGTFRDVAASAGVNGDRWTTSCLVADLNGDGLPDLYEVNYLQGDNVFSLICDKGQNARSCSPTEFDAQQDRVFVNSGNGQFQEMTAKSGIETSNGKGLGIVAGDFYGTGQLSLFVANDMTANFYFENLAKRGGPLQFAERGVVSGLAYDRDGKAQACMGVAAGDSNNDGRLDFFVTNFYRESNTLFEQQAGGYFRDKTRQSQLRASSMGMLGFGTQFLDADLDGELDLVVANGHVDDYTHVGTPFQMRPQLLVGKRGRYREVLDAGNYFRRELLGRGLSLIDFDRDGKQDFVVSHLDAKLALVANRSADTGHFVTLTLIGTDSGRDAIGSHVRATLGDRQLYRQLTAGDGYQASNQRQIVIGLGAAEQIDSLSITWPSGNQTQVKNLAADQHFLAIEGIPGLQSLPR